MKRNLFPVFILLLVVPILAFAGVRLEQSTKLVKGDIAFPGFPIQAAMNTQTGDTLVIWNESVNFNENSISGRIVNAKGKTTGKPFQLAEHPAIMPALTYNPGKNEFLLVYSAGSEESANIIVQRLTANGRPTGVAIDLTSNDSRSAGHPNQEARVWFNPKTGGYTVIWFSGSDIVGSPPPFCAISSLTAKGVPGDPFETRAREGGCDALGLDFAYLPSAKKQLVFTRFLADDRQSADYMLGIIDPSLKNDGKFIKISKNPVVDPAPGNKVLFIWGGNIALRAESSAIVYYTDNSNVKGRNRGGREKRSGGFLNAFRPPRDKTQLYWPSAAFVNTSKGLRGLLIAIEDANLDGTATIWAQELNSKGKPVGAPAKLKTTSATEEIKIGKIIALPVDPAAGVARFVWYGTVARRTNEGDEILKLKLALTEQ